MKNFKPLAVGIICFLLGMATMWGINFYQESMRKIERMQKIAQDPFQQFFGNFWGTPDSDFSQNEDRSGLFNLEKKLHDFLFQRKKQQQPTPDSWFSDFFQTEKLYDVGELTEREDNQYHYYELNIKDKTPNEFKVIVENGYITITGQLSAGEHSVMSFQRTFPAPPDIDPDGYTIEQNGDRLVFKFPKIETI